MSETTTNTGASTATVESYLQFWNAEPGEAQRLIAAELFASDVRYVTPVGVRTGVEAQLEFTRQFIEGVGKYRFLARTEPDLHHDRVRVPWTITVGDRTFAEGTDVLSTDADGRVTAVTSFLDRAPDGFAEHHGGAA